MNVLYERDKNKLIIEDLVFTVTNNVRNEIDPNFIRRIGEKKEVVRTVNRDRSTGKPYMPRKFPKGTCGIISVEWWHEMNGISNFDKEVYGTVRIRTDAHQAVEVWTLDAGGGYLRKSGTFSEDYGYLFHYSPSRTTLGCGRLDSQDSCIKLAHFVAKALETQSVSIEVV